jgi:3-dehydroquinate synthase
MMRDLTVNLAGSQYDIRIGVGLESALSELCQSLLAQNRKIAVITDDRVADSQQVFLQQAFGEAPRLVLPHGETTKSFVFLQGCCDFLSQQKLDRGGVLFAVGGGVVGDLAGFAAAVYLRGIDFYQVPTTLLAMVDSSVGGKTGINIAAGKNLVGAFHQPQGVYADTNTLTTLPPREFSAGMAEIIKHGMLADAGLFSELEHLGALHPRHERLPEIIARNCAIKAGVVQADEKETAATGGRALLNLGHTFGHAVEAVAGYGAYLHGEAVGLGLTLAARLSRRLGYLSNEEVARVDVLVGRYNLPVRLRSPLSCEALMQAMSRDKKVKQGTLRFVAMEKLGHAITVNEVDPAWIEELWREAGAAL